MKNDLNPRLIPIADFAYELPLSRIAQEPLTHRDASRLLVYQGGVIEESTYRRIADFLPSRTLLVFNDSRVVPARLHFRKPSGGIIEIFCLEPADQIDPQASLSQSVTVIWKCLVGGASKWKRGQVMISERSIDKKLIHLSASITGRDADTFLICFEWNDDTLSFSEILDHFGEMPIPPYLDREANDDDRVRYQTIYARSSGSVAAPTAGLHFTERVMAELKEKKIDQLFVTLHVGAGTFKPVKAAQIGDHIMHSEWIEISRASITELIKAVKIFAVGTTSTRNLETIYWLGVKLSLTPTIVPGELSLGQWEVYDELWQTDLTKTQALQLLLDWMDANHLDAVIATTQLLIVPGYDLKIVEGLITNFHQPQSTLLLMIAAFVGDDWKKIYEYALAKDFRFLSYGDGCLLIP